MDALLKKMAWKPTMTVAYRNTPASFAPLEALAAQGRESSELTQGSYDFIIACVHNRQEVATMVPSIMSHMHPKSLLWICYPKRTGKIPTDLSRDHGWDSIMGIGLRHLNLISIDSDWTAWGTELGKEETSEKTRKRSQDRNELLAQYMNHETREMWYPEDMQVVLDSDPISATFFHKLSFTNRKEYVEWIVTAKRPETRAQRLAQLLTYLSQGRKNPSGR